MAFTPSSLLVCHVVENLPYMPHRVSASTQHLSSRQLRRSEDRCRNQACSPKNLLADMPLLRSESVHQWPNWRNLVPWQREGWRQSRVERIVQEAQGESERSINTSASFKTETETHGGWSDKRLLWWRRVADWVDAVKYSQRVTWCLEVSLR